MSARTPPSPAKALAAFCHRLGSPLGTLVNHLHLLELDRDDLPQAARESVAQLQRATTQMRALLERTRHWLDAMERPLEPASRPLRELLHVLGWPQVDADRTACVDLDAGDDLGAHLRAHGALEDVRIGTDGVELIWRGDHDAPSDDEVEDALDPFQPAPLAPRWGCARLLAQRMGGSLAVRPASPTRAILTLPLEVVEAPR